MNRLIFAYGDADEAAEVPELSDCALLELSVLAHPGHVRILSGRTDGRARLLMRAADLQSPLLNHFRLPGLGLSASGNRVGYEVESYADTGVGCSIWAKLPFETSAVVNYFVEKLPQ